MYKHYISFSGIKRNLEEIDVLATSDRAKLETHYGFLSAIAHSPIGLVDELHGHNGVVGTFYGPTNRLINLYISAALTLVIETFLPWVIEYEFLPEGKLVEARELLEPKEILLSELGFPFGADHAFDLWRRSLPRIAQDLPRSVPLDLSNEYLDSDFLSRIEMMHTAQTEYSVGKTWFPINLFGV